MRVPQGLDYCYRSFLDLQFHLYSAGTRETVLVSGVQMEPVSGDGRIENTCETDVEPCDSILPLDPIDHGFWENLAWVWLHKANRDPVY